jgi:tRNA uridine 5-carbamoylmethylation protein Kti12
MLWSSGFELRQIIEFERENRIRRKIYDMMIEVGREHGWDIEWGNYEDKIVQRLSRNFDRPMMDRVWIWPLVCSGKEPQWIVDIYTGDRLVKHKEVPVRKYRSLYDLSRHVNQVNAEIENVLKRGLR